MVIVDDATGCTDGEFFQSETTHASYDTLEGWIGLYGVPGSLYVDKDSIYRCERAASVPEQIAGQEPRTQFGRAMDELGVELILAHSPQAKGGVERRNGILQDRLVKALRLEGSSDLATASEFLRKKFWPEFNRKFQVKARSRAGAHTRAPRHLDEILSWQEERVVSNDWRVQWKGQSYQIGREEESLGLPGRKVMLRRRRNGQVEAMLTLAKTKPGCVLKRARFLRAGVSQFCRVRAHEIVGPDASCHDSWTVLYWNKTREKSFGSFFRGTGMAACPLLTRRRDQKSDSQKITEGLYLIRRPNHRLHSRVAGGLCFYFHGQLRNKLHKHWERAHGCESVSPAAGG